jgi:folate-binding protein YgfZ
MHIALLPDRGVVKVAGADANATRFLNGLVTTDLGRLAPGRPRFAALLTPQGKIIADFIIAEAADEDGGGLFLDCPRALAATLVERLTFYKLRAKVTVEDLSATLAVMAFWGQNGAVCETDYGLCYPDPRLAELGGRCIVPANLTSGAAAELGAQLASADLYEAHRIAHGIPRGGLDFIYGDAFPHEADMDQLAGVDFDKGCFVGQEVVSRIEHRGSARTRVVPVAYEGAAPAPGLPVQAGEQNLGMMGSAASGRGLAALRLDRTEEALARGAALASGGIALRLVKPGWARFPWPGDAKTQDASSGDASSGDAKAAG